MLLDKLVKVHRVHVVTLCVRESGNIPWRNRASDPFRKLFAFSSPTGKAPSLSDAPQSVQTLSR